MTEASPKIGISSCLMGNEVRYDGGHKYNRYIGRTLVDYFDLVAFCPEAGAGLGTPRKPIHLVSFDNGIRAVDVDDSSLDRTSMLEAFGLNNQSRIDTLSGFILKKDSPSCGMERVKLYDKQRLNSPPERKGQGIFARYLTKQHPLLPLEEEGRLNDPVLRENFIERVFIYQRWQTMQIKGMGPADLVSFHSNHKYIIMAHDQDQVVRLGQIVAIAGVHDFNELGSEYIHLLMKILKRKVSRGKHANILYHLMGYLHKHLATDDRQELINTIEQYRLGYVPLIVPITLLKHHFRKHPHPYINRQYHLNPHPGELMLRNEL